MKTLTLLLIVFVLEARGYLIRVPTTPMIQESSAPIGWVQLQKLILPLFENVCEESGDPIIVKLSQEFQQDLTNGNYQKPEVITNLQNLKGLLPKGEIFTEYKIDHVNELKVIYELFYYANDFNTFYKAACWARQNVNCGLFVDALYAAIIHRRDTEKISLLAPYEILPNYFIRKDFIARASLLVAGNEVPLCDWVRNDGNAYILDVNYTSNFYDNEDESKLVYFYEDIGLNSYYYLSKLKMLPWINTKPQRKYGEYLYYQIKQLMARYNLERYSNGLQEIEGINWDNFNVLPYDPMLVYSDGSDFSQRTLTLLESNENLTFLKNIENNIGTVVTHMREGGFNKSDILNHLMEILITSEKSYENMALQTLNEENFINNSPPSVLGHYMTTLRDPVFWALNKKMVDIVDNALKVLPGYTRNQLYFPGVEILNIEVKKMTTTVDKFVFDVTDALETSENDTKFRVKISQSRLNHKPFSIKVNITSLVTQKGLMKIYLGPKVKPGEHALKKNLFMLLDSSEINLKFGTNMITRTSMEIIDNSNDLMSINTIRKKLVDADFGLDSLTLKSVEEQIRLPSRLVIPKGLTEGLALQIFVFIVPFGKVGDNTIDSEVNKNIIFSPGFPLDLDIEVWQLFDLPNALIKDIVVTHKDDEQPTNYYSKSGPKTWQNNENYSPSEKVALPLKSRSPFPMRKEPYDYKSKQGQYRKNEDYTIKKGNYKYKKDEVQTIDTFFKTDDDKTFNVDITTENKENYIPVDTIKVNEDKFGFLVSTDMMNYESPLLQEKNKIVTDDEIGQEKSFEDSNENINVEFEFDDKIVAGKTTDEINKSDKNEEVHIYIKNFKNIKQDNISIGSDEQFFDNTAMLDKKIQYKGKKEVHVDDTKDTKDIGTDISSEDNLYKKTNKKIIYNVTNAHKIVPHKTSEDYDEVTYKKIVDIKNIQKRVPTIYDIILNPFDETIGSDEKLYE